MQRFTELKVWQRAHALVLEIYRISTSFPQEERFGVTSQLRRAITSVPTNIAEGSRRQGQQEYSRFLNVAQGSAAEVEYLLILSRDLGARRWVEPDPRARSASRTTLDSELSTLDSAASLPSFGCGGAALRKDP